MWRTGLPAQRNWVLRRRRHHLLQRFDAAAVQPVPAAYVRAYDVRVGSHEETSSRHRVEASGSQKPASP